MKIRASILAMGTATVLFTGCVGELASMASNVGTIVGTGSELMNMVQEVEVSGARNKNFSSSDFKKIKSVSFDFSSEASWWSTKSKGFSDNIETQLMKLGLDTYKKDSDKVQVSIKGTVTGSHKYSSSFANSEFKSAISEISFSMVDKSTGKTMASVNLSYKKGVSNINGAKDVAKALKALVDYPDMEVSKAFEQMK